MGFERQSVHSWATARWQVDCLVAGILSPRGIVHKKGIAFLSSCEILHTGANIGTLTRLPQVFVLHFVIQVYFQVFSLNKQTKRRMCKY